MSLGPDPVTGVARQRSRTVHGDETDAQAARKRLAADATRLRARRRVDPRRSLAELLEIWMAADHRWRPSTVAGYASAVAALSRDRLGGVRLSKVTPRTVRAACRAWTTSGVGDPTVWSRVRVLRSAPRWAAHEGLVETNPVAAMHGPPHARTRLHVPVHEVRALLRSAEADVTDTRATAQGRGPWTREMAWLHRAEQVLLLLRLAADSGARRGELAALRWSDLDGPALTISRGTSGEIVGPTKTGRIRRLTLGATSIATWHRLERRWRRRAAIARSTPRYKDHIPASEPVTPNEAGGQAFGPWVFSRDPLHRTRLTTGALGHWFAAFTKAAGYPDVTLHRLRHSVATALVSRGDILGAQQRLGHADAHTTLRIYSHAQPLADLKAAALLDHLYDTDDKSSTTLREHRPSGGDVSG